MRDTMKGTGRGSSLFVCPVCSRPLERDGRTLRCEDGHSFDLARSGYVNLIAGRAPKLEPDSREMVAARVAIFSRGRYAELRRALADMARKYCDGALLDAGCGEGYFMEDAAREFRTAGIDLSKFAADAAAKRLHGAAEIAVASVYKLPIADRSMSLVQNIFSPYCGAEFRRVLADGGTLVVASPSACHLAELKAIVYDEPPTAAPREHRLDGFKLVEEREIAASETIDGIELRALFAMTPHSRSHAAHPERLNAVDALTVTTGFDVAVYRKE